MSAVTRGGAASRGRLRARIATVVGAAALTVGLAAGTSSAEVIVQWYGYTSAGAKACNNAANVAGPECPETGGPPEVGNRQSSKPCSVAADCCAAVRGPFGACRTRRQRGMPVRRSGVRKSNVLSGRSVRLSDIALRNVC